MTDKNGFCLNEYGSALLIKAINNCSEELQEEVADELKKLRLNQT